MTPDTIYFHSQWDQLIAAVREGEESNAANEAAELIVQVAIRRNRRMLLAMLRAIQREMSRAEQRMRDGR